MKEESKKTDGIISRSNANRLQILPQNHTLEIATV